MKFPAAAPSIILPMNKPITLCVPAKTIQPMAVLNMLKIRTGLRPILSDKDPSKGALKNAKNENVAKSKVTIKGETPKELT